MTRRRILFAAAIACAFPTASVTAREPDRVYDRFGERRAVFTDWLAACRPGGDCSARTYNGIDPEAPAADANYMIRVSSGAPGLGYDVVFTGISAMVHEASEISVFIDEEETAFLIPGENLGWQIVPDGAVNDYLLSQSISNVAIVPAMRAGGRMTLAFHDSEGRSRLVGFSLLGLSAALNWIERNRYGL